MTLPADDAEVWTDSGSPRYDSAMPRHLFIVARDQPDLWAHLAREFSGEPGVQVLLDRRRTDRRRSARPSDEERRRRDRRSRPPVQQELTALNFALVAAD